MKRQATAILLAGGQSTRMGTDKARLLWGGTTLLQHIHALLSAHFDEVLLASGAPDRYADLGLPGLADAPEARGPMAGVIAGLLAARRETCYLHPCDNPEVDPALLDALFAALQPPHDAALLQVPGEPYPQPLCALYRRDAALAAFTTAATTGHYALHRALPPLRPASLIWGFSPKNLNTPNDLSAPPKQYP